MRSIEERYADAVRNYSRAAYQHTLSAGPEANVDKRDSVAHAAWLGHVRSAQAGLGMVMVLRRIKEASPELLPAALEQLDLSSLLTEFGLSVQLQRYLHEVGGDTNDLDEVHYMTRRDAA
jgi:hypothetical protein